MTKICNGSEGVKKFRLAAENGLLSPPLSSKRRRGRGIAAHFFHSFSVMAGKQARGSVLTFFAPRPLEKSAGLTPTPPAITDGLLKSFNYEN